MNVEENEMVVEDAVAVKAAMANIPPPPPVKKQPEEVMMNGFSRDRHGALRCSGHRTAGFVPKSVKPKVVLFSELEGYRVAAMMTKKEKQNGTHNPGVPLGLVPCANGFDHFHLGHSPKNIGRTVPVVIRLQLLIERLADRFSK